MLADKLLFNGRVYTLDAARPRASAVAVVGGRVLAVGDAPSMHDLLALDGEAIDLQGRCVLPGLIDCHIHFMSYALGLRELDLGDAASLGEALARVAERAREMPSDRCHPELAEGWVVGRGWDQERWSERRFPTIVDLDRIAPEKLLVLKAKSGHALVANSCALQLAGIGADTPDPPGGRIGRDAAGQPNGLLFEESAMALVSGLIPRPTSEETDDALLKAFPNAWRVGLTAIHDVDGTRAFGAYQRLHAREALGLRVVKYLPARVLDDVLAVGLRAGLGDDWLRVGGIKVFVDGALGSRTAAMLAPYEGEPDNVGVLTMGEDELCALVGKATEGGLPLAIHAIGDRANHLVLEVLTETGTSGLRHRIEHVQLLHPDDVSRLAALGVVASMQPIHATQDCEMADRYWGERCATAYAWRSLLNASTVLAFGSDCPVEDFNPFLGIHAAATRRRVDGFPDPQGWYPEQRLTVEEAVRAYTLGAAYAAGLEDCLGALAPGKLADLIVLDRDIFTCDPMAISETQVEMTMIGGRVVYGL